MFDFSQPRLLCRVLLSCSLAPFAAFAKIGADLPWITYEAEDMMTSGTVLGPSYQPHRVEAESSRQMAVKLVTDDYVEFTATIEANTLVVRYSLPDAPQGGGMEDALELSINGRTVRTLPLTSRYMHLYGSYPFSNDPSEGKPRNFYDELPVKQLSIAAGDVVRFRKKPGPADYCIIDFVDLEQVAPPLAAPTGSLSVRDFGALGNGRSDDTAALQACLAAALTQGRTVWVPAGDYKITGDIILHDGATIQGAGMWHTAFVGDEDLYDQADRRVRFKLAGSGIRVADFAIFGRLNYRNDHEPNDGLIGADCIDSTIERIWVEHTKAGAWIYNGIRLRIEGCRFRNLIADAVNLCVGTSDSIVENCSARGTGDDCFAIWPVPSDQGFDQVARPGRNVIRRCTGQLTFLANGGAIYGGYNNVLEDCLFTDIGTGCGILISTTFPTSDDERGVDNNFSGETIVRNSELIRCGGYDHHWAWRGSFQIALDRRSISGLRISDIVIQDSFSDGVTVVAPGAAKGEGTLSDSRLKHVSIRNSGLSGHTRGDLWIRDDVQGELVLEDSEIATVRNDSQNFQLRH
jgi:hypothetical protein